MYIKASKLQNMKRVSPTCLLHFKNVKKEREKDVREDGGGRVAW